MLEASFISPDELAQMLKQSPQGTLVLTADLAGTRRLLKLCGDAVPDVFIEGLPEDRRAFNAICAYPPEKLPEGYRRIVLAGVPDWFEIPEGAEVCRLDVKPQWRKLLPDVDGMRNVYKAVRAVVKGVERWEDFGMLIHLVSRYADVEYIAAAASLLALDDMALIELDLNKRPTGLKLNPMHKTDPDSSAVWRALQAWKADD